MFDYSSVLNQRRRVRIRFFTVNNILGNKLNMSRKLLSYIVHTTSHHNKENIAQFTLHAQLQFVMSIFLTFGESLSRYNGHIYNKHLTFRNTQNPVSRRIIKSG